MNALAQKIDLSNGELRLLFWRINYKMIIQIVNVEFAPNKKFTVKWYMETESNEINSQPLIDLPENEILINLTPEEFNSYARAYSIFYTKYYSAPLKIPRIKTAIESAEDKIHSFSHIKIKWFASDPKPIFFYPNSIGRFTDLEYKIYSHVRKELHTLFGIDRKKSDNPTGMKSDGIIDFQTKQISAYYEFLNRLEQRKMKFIQQQEVELNAFIEKFTIGSSEKIEFQNI